MEIGLFFGSFNPIHIGHLAIANYLLEFGNLDKIWLIVSPHNPLKKEETLLDENERYKMVELALNSDLQILPSDIEFKLPKPSYTIDTLKFIDQKNPDYDLRLIIGSDNLESFNQWKNYDTILRDYKLIVYPRAGFGLGKYNNHPNVKLIDAPEMDISSSFIRESIKKGKNVRYFLPCNVNDYILKNHFYEK
ncbi:MAG: nicotinate (nicotinamide) nucleotide adenylyltransferase [Bacteroidales bacterium]